MRRRPPLTVRPSRYNHGQDVWKRTCERPPALVAGGLSRSRVRGVANADQQRPGDLRWAERTNSASNVDKQLCIGKMLPMPDPELIGTKAAAGILQVHGSTVSRMVKEGRLDCVRLTDAPASPMLFRRSDIEALAAELKVAS